MDFHTVDNWTQNKLDRTKSSRMGWTDVALSIQGPILKDMAMQFTQRWNFIYNEKYRIRFTGGERYKKLPEQFSDSADPKVRKNIHGMKEKVKVQFGDYTPAGYGGGYSSCGQGEPGAAQQPSQYQPTLDEPQKDEDQDALGDRDGVRSQFLRSASKWSHGTRETEVGLFASHHVY